MALQPNVNFAGNPLEGLPFPTHEHWTAVSATLDASGESASGVGVLVWATGPGTSKVVSSAGGKIAWVALAPTFANAGTTLRVGINDLDATGVEDGTHDVYADLVGGTDVITAGVMVTTMATGSKTIAHGAEVAIVVEMTARAGADTVQVSRSNSNLAHPYASLDTGSGPTKTLGTPMFVVIADDGTVGWLYASVSPHVITVTTLGSGSTPDEYAQIFQVPYPTTVYGIAVLVDNVAGADTWELVLYSDPTGTPVAQRTATPNPVLIRATTDATIVYGLFTSGYALLPNTNYAVAMRPTSANTLTLTRMLFGAGNGMLRMPTRFGTSASEGTRSDNTGAFASNTEALPMIGPIFSAFDDGASVGGGGTSRRPRLITVS